MWLAAPQCTCVRELQGLGNLTTVGQDMLVADNPALTTLAGLTALASVGADGWGDMIIRNNPQLSDLGGLASQVGWSAIAAARLPSWRACAELARVRRVGARATPLGSGSRALPRQQATQRSRPHSAAWCLPLPWLRCSYGTCRAVSNLLSIAAAAHSLGCRSPASADLPRLQTTLGCRSPRWTC